MMRRWYIIQVDIDASKSLQQDFAVTGFIYCIFLAKHPSDKITNDTFSRWWSEWYIYSRDGISNDIIFEDRMIFLPIYFA